MPSSQKEEFLWWALRFIFSNYWYVMTWKKFCWKNHQLLLPAVLSLPNHLGLATTSFQMGLLVALQAGGWHWLFSSALAWAFYETHTICFSPHLPLLASSLVRRALPLSSCMRGLRTQTPKAEANLGISCPKKGGEGDRLLMVSVSFPNCQW